MSRYAFRMDPRSKEVATVQELEEPTDFADDLDNIRLQNFKDDITELFGELHSDDWAGWGA